MSRFQFGRIIAWIGRLLVFALLALVLIVPQWSTHHDEATQLRGIVGLMGYDFVSWELNTLLDKAEAALLGTPLLMDATTQHDVMLDFLALLGETTAAERQLDMAYASGDEATVQQLTPVVTQLRGQVETRQAVAEAVLEHQAASVLADESFAVFGRTWPPVQAALTPLPYMLIVSPRDEIRRVYSIPLKPGLTIDERETLEEVVADQLGYSALVVPIGGLGIYPAMIQESTNINWLASVFAHEWAHHWLMFKPLGSQFLLPAGQIAPAVWTMNETTASVLGDEVGRKLIERYYPEHVPVAPVEESVGVDSAESEPPAFDFRAEMSITRHKVDELLASGQVDEAETYMEQRRQLFVANGYSIRKLNQAYFSFYGSYADEPGATGGDPVGPLVVELRQQSDSLRDFMNAIASVTSLEQLKQTVENTKR